MSLAWFVVSEVVIFTITFFKTSLYCDGFIESEQEFLLHLSELGCPSGSDSE